MIVYTAGSYGARAGASPETIQANVDAAIEAGRDLITAGHVPLVPHLNHYVQNHGPHICTEDRWLEICLALVERCDAVLMLPGWQESQGAKAEREHALSKGIPVYSRLADLPLPDSERRRRILRNHPAAAPCHQCPDVLECICQDLKVLDMGRFACRRAA